MGPHFLLTFGTDLGRARNLRINNVNMSTTDDMMRDAMNTMVDAQAIEGAGGRISYLRGASLIETLVTPVDLGL